MKILLETMRKKRGWSQAVLADFADIRRPQLSEIEIGKRNPEVETLWKIAAALDVPLSELLRIAERRMGAAVGEP